MKEQLIATLGNSKNYSLAVAAAMPAGQYNFKPAGAGWSFAELVQHIAYGIEWWEANFIKGTKTAWDPPAVSNKAKDVISYLTDAYHSLETTVSKIKLTDEAVQAFHATLDHITHHRGQAVLYLRCNGIAPPEYVY